MNGAKRWIGPSLLLFAGAVTLGSASCRDLVAGDSVDIIEELCATLDACYQGQYACADLDAKARDDARQADLTSFLGLFGSPTCTLDSCAGSLACLDHPLFCADNAQPCGVDENCCDWSAGLSSCRGPSDGEGACCGLDGALCGEGTTACCDSECIDGRCGGRVCSFIGDSCRWSADCCSGRCELGDGGTKECTEKLCADPGEPCLSSEECCGDENVATSLQCLPDEQGAFVCKLPAVCAGFAEQCDPADPGSCCGDNECRLSLGTGLTVCVSPLPGECKPVGFDCAADADCCDDSICALSVAQSLCQPKPDPNCGKAGVACMGGESCCSGLCSEGQCIQATGANCDEILGLCHSPLVPGTIISSDCDVYINDPCVQEVAQQEFCGCTAWDALCVEDYLTCLEAG